MPLLDRSTAINVGVAENPPGPETEISPFPIEV